MLGFYLWESFIFHFLRNHSYAPTVVRLWYFSAAFAHPFSVLLPRTFVCASFSTCLLALLLFCPPNQLSSLRVEMLNESLSNTCVQLRSYRAFKISVSLPWWFLINTKHQGFIDTNKMRWLRPWLIKCVIILEISGVRNLLDISSWWLHWPVINKNKI